MPRRPAPVPRMVDLEALLLRDYELHERRSVGRARAGLAHLGQYFSAVDPAKCYDLTSRYVIRRRGAGAAAATIRYEVALLGRSLTLAARVGLISTRPYLARPTVQNARQGFLDHASMRSLLYCLPQPIRDAALFAYVTGWRRAEVFGLTWDRVDLRAGVARLDVGATKNGDGRAFPFGCHPRLRRMMERRALERRSGLYVFGRDHGGRVVTFDRPWKMACRDAGVGHILFHDLRRSAVRNLERAGVPRSTAMALTGHRTENTYLRYAITNDRDLSRGVRMLARLQGRGHDEEEGEESGGRGAREQADCQAVGPPPPRDR